MSEHECVKITLKFSVEILGKEWEWADKVDLMDIHETFKNGELAIKRILGLERRDCPTKS